MTGYVCFLFTLCGVVSLCGCGTLSPTVNEATSSLLPTVNNVTSSPWNSFDDAMKSFEQVIPNKTTLSQLKQYGFDLDTTPNVKSLNYVDIAVSTKSIDWEELDGPLQACVKARDRCRGYEFSPQVMRNKRRGNFWLDIFNFKRATHKSGWSFKALFVVIDDVVVYKLWSGSRHLEEEQTVSNPLGPFQESAGGLLLRAIP